MLSACLQFLEIMHDYHNMRFAVRSHQRVFPQALYYIPMLCSFLAVPNFKPPNLWACTHLFLKHWKVWTLEIFALWLYMILRLSWGRIILFLLYALSYIAAAGGMSRYKMTYGGLKIVHLKISWVKSHLTMYIHVNLDIYQSHPLLWNMSILLIMIYQAIFMCVLK